MVVEGHVEWHMWDQRFLSEERERSSGVAHPMAARVRPSRRGRMCARIMSTWRREKVVVAVSSRLPLTVAVVVAQVILVVAGRQIFFFFERIIMGWRGLYTGGAKEQKEFVIFFLKVPPSYTITIYFR